MIFKYFSIFKKIAFLKTNMPNLSIIKWLGLYSLIGPLGVTVGIFIARMQSPWLEAAIVAITAGTFLYVGATEIVNEEFEEVEGREKWVKFISFLGGISTILGGIYLFHIYYKFDLLRNFKS